MNWPRDGRVCEPRDIPARLERLMSPFARLRITAIWLFQRRRKHARRIKAKP